MKYTDDLKFALPEHSDNAEIEVINNNFRTVKTELKSLADKIIEVDGNVVFGTYTGDGQAIQQINLGFTPAAIIIYGSNYRDSNAFMSYTNGALAFDGYASTGIEIIENGFKVKYEHQNQNYAINLNAVGTHAFIAYKKSDVVVVG